MYRAQPPFARAGTALEISCPGQPGVARFADNGDAALADVVENRIASQVVANVIARSDAHVLVDDGALDARALAHVHVVEKDRVANLGALVDPDIAAEHTVLDEAASDHAAARHDRLHQHAPAAIVVEHEL